MAESLKNISKVDFAMLQFINEILLKSKAEIYDLGKINSSKIRSILSSFNIFIIIQTIADGFKLLRDIDSIK